MKKRMKGRMVIEMTLNLLFFTVTFKPIKMTAKEALHQERIKQIKEENATKISQYRYFM